MLVQCSTFANMHMSFAKLVVSFLLGFTFEKMTLKTFFDFYSILKFMLYHD